MYTTQTSPRERGLCDTQMALILALCTCELIRVLYQTFVIVQLLERTGNAPRASVLF